MFRRRVDLEQAFIKPNTSWSQIAWILYINKAWKLGTSVKKCSSLERLGNNDLEQAFDNEGGLKVE